MVTSGTDPEDIVNQLAGVNGVLRDDIIVQEGKVTTYIAKNMIKDLREMEGVLVEVLDETEHEYLIVAEPIDSGMQ